MTAILEHQACSISRACGREKSQDDARSLSTNKEHARQLQPPKAWFLLRAWAIDNDVVAARVVATPAAISLIGRLRDKHGPLMFHQSGGCCDGSSPMCYPQGEFYLGNADVEIGEIAGARFYTNAAQFDYWQHTKLIIDVVPGHGGMFSLENAEGVRFLTRSELFSDSELKQLRPVERCS